jgi:hypothetical protein
MFEGGRERVADEEADRQGRLTGGDVLDPPAGCVGSGQQRPGLGEDLESGGRERDVPARSQQQLGAELLFELADLAAEHRLCDVEAFRRPSEVQLLRDGDEVAQLPQIQRGAQLQTHAARDRRRSKRC